MSFNTSVTDYGSNQAATTESSGDFNKIRHLINENTQRIRRNNIQMQKMVSQIGGPTDTLGLRDKLHKLQHQTNEVAKETNRNLQSFISIPSINGRQHKQTKEMLTNEFTTVLKDFQSLQRSQMNEEKNALMRKKKADQQSQIIEAEQNDFSSDLFGNASTQEQATKEKQDTEQMEETEGEIRKLELDISDINQVFRDLSLLIHQQGELVDSIEANTESASIGISRGTEELLKARQYRDKIRRRKFFLISIATVIISIIILIIIVSASRS